MSGNGARTDQTRTRSSLRRVRQRKVQRETPGSRRPALRSQRALHVYCRGGVADSVSEGLKERRLESVLGAVATGSELMPEHNPVASAPGTDLIAPSQT